MQISKNCMGLFCFAGTSVQNAICRQPVLSGCIFVLDDDANAVVHKEVLALWMLTRTQTLQKTIMERLPPVPTGRGQPLVFLLSARECVCCSRLTGSSDQWSRAGAPVLHRPGRRAGQASIPASCRRNGSSASASLPSVLCECRPMRNQKGHSVRH